VEEMVNRGVKLQMNIGSLIGSYGPEVKSFSEKLVDDEVVEFVGSDCHHIQHLETINYAKKLPYFHKLVKQKQILNSSL
jgi:tyrosine-protein phosphatase YwqE